MLNFWIEQNLDFCYLHNSMYLDVHKAENEPFELFKLQNLCKKIAYNLYSLLRAQQKGERKCSRGLESSKKK
jgi:hypothetical protein